MKRPAMKRVVIDASALIGLCTSEPTKVQKVADALKEYAAGEYILYAPHLIVIESLYILCKKQQDGSLLPIPYQTAFVSLQMMLKRIILPDEGDASLMARADEIRQGYGCSHSADSVYLALAEELAQQGATELLTFDTGQKRQAEALIPQIMVNLLIA